MRSLRAGAVPALATSQRRFGMPSASQAADGHRRGDLDGASGSGHGSEGMKRVVYVVGHLRPDADSVCSAIAYAHLKNLLGEANVRPARAGELDAETAFVLRHFGVPTPELLTDASGLDLILVDHNEIAQALSHIEQARILEIWEHHRIGDIRLPKAILFHCEPVGATATLIGELYFAHGITPPRAMAGLLLAAILSDTVLFRSPTTTGKDRRLAARLEPLAGVDARFGEELLRRKATAATRRTAAEILRDDYKEFDLGGSRVGIAQVEVLGPRALAHVESDLLDAMRAQRQARGLTQLVLMVTDVEGRASDLWVVGDRLDAFERALGPLEDGRVRAPGLMSRKKQLVPTLERVLAAPDATSREGARLPARAPP